MNGIQKIELSNVVDCSAVVRFSPIVSEKTVQSGFEGLSLQADGFPVMVNGVRVTTVEHLFHALKFTDARLQQDVLKRSAPSTCKRVSKEDMAAVRKDWDEIKFAVLGYCLRVKLVWNSMKFGKLLKATGDMAILAEGNDGLGRLLMELRDEYLSQGHNLFRVEAPDVGLVFLGKPLSVIEREKHFKNHDYVSPYEGVY